MKICLNLPKICQEYRRLFPDTVYFVSAFDGWSIFIRAQMRLLFLTQRYVFKMEFILLKIFSITFHVLLHGVSQSCVC